MSRRRHAVKRRSSLVTRWYADPARSLTMTTKVEADTRAWRSEADRIMRFWGERLIADPNACILTTEMLEAFNFWLQINKHKGALRNHSHISGD
jgi:phage/plasmid-associated DNA primase